MEKTALPGIALLAFPEQSEFLLHELSDRFHFEDAPSAEYGGLLYFDDRDMFFEKTGGRLPYWCRTAMLSPFLLRFESIGEAASALKSVQRNWAPHQFTCFRRAQLIQEKLPYLNLGPRKFPAKIPVSPMGLYTLLDKNTMLASAETSSTLPAGTLLFEEDHENPPSRAYLKLYEALSLARLLNGTEFPGSGQNCLDAGACPGGWTWAMADLGVNVLAVDRSELDSGLMRHPLVTFRAHDAFTLRPEEIGKTDWVLSDVICYPERLLRWVRSWLESGLAENLICTIKLQGAIDWNLIAEFEKIEGSRIVHLNYNKHELTWLHTKKDVS